MVWQNRVEQTLPASVCPRAVFEKCPNVPSVSCVYKLRSVVNSLAARGLLSAVPISFVAKSWAVSLLHFVPVADERRGRPLIWVCQRMGLPSSLSREKEEIQTGSVLCWSKQKTFITPLLLSSHGLFVYFTYCNQPGDSSRGTEGAATLLQPLLLVRVPSRVPGCAFPLPCTWCAMQPCAALVLGGWWSQPDTVSFDAA